MRLRGMLSPLVLRVRMRLLCSVPPQNTLIICQRYNESASHSEKYRILNNNGCVSPNAKVWLPMMPPLSGRLLLVAWAREEITNFSLGLHSAHLKKPLAAPQVCNVPQHEMDRE